MKQEQMQEIALMRYRVIAPLITGLDSSYPSQTAFCQEVSAKGVLGPDGQLRHYAPSTIERWYSDYNKYGFDALFLKGGRTPGAAESSIRIFRNRSVI